MRERDSWEICCPEQLDVHFVSRRTERHPRARDVHNGECSNYTSTHDPGADNARADDSGPHHARANNGRSNFACTDYGVSNFPCSDHAPPDNQCTYNTTTHRRSYIWRGAFSCQVDTRGDAFSTLSILKAPCCGTVSQD